MNTNSPNRVPSRRGPAHRAPIAMRPIFDGVSAYVDVTLTGNVDASAPFRAKLIAKGAKVTANICPTTTHVIFRAADAARGVALHRKLAETKFKVDRVEVVSPLWVTNSERRGEMVDAKDFATTPRGVPSKYSTTPKRNVTPKNASRSGTKKRDRRVLGIGGFDEVRLGRATNGGDRGGVGRGTKERRRRGAAEEDVRGGGASDVGEEKTQGRVRCGRDQ